MLSLALMAALSIGQDDSAIVDTSPIVVPSTCSGVAPEGGGHYKLVNHCNFPVYWTLSCRQDFNCYGGTTFYVAAGGSREVIVGVNFQLDGPYPS